MHQAEEVLAANLPAPASAGEAPPFAISDVETFTGFVAVLTLVQLAQLMIATVARHLAAENAAAVGSLRGDRQGGSS